MTGDQAQAAGEREYARVTGKVSPARFSKALVRETLEKQIATLQDAYQFDPDDGWQQVAGKGEERNRAYGEYAAYCAILEELCQ